MLERAARAIFAIEHPPVDGIEWADLSKEAEQEHYRDLARAVLQAIREPSEAMVEAAAETPGMKAVSNAMALHQARGFAFDAGAFEAGSPLHQAWRAAIDTALTE